MKYGLVGAGAGEGDEDAAYTDLYLRAYLEQIEAYAAAVNFG